MATSAATLLVEIGADLRDFRRGMQDMQSTVQRTSKNMARMGKRMTLMLTAPLAAAGGAAIKTASDVEEMQTKMQAVFKDATDDVQAWSETTASEINRSKFDLQEYATTLQDTFVPMGVARDQATELSKEVAELGVDLASFNNIADDEAIRALQSALVGNHRAVRQFGSSITQARLEQELMNQGMAESVQTATEQEKIMARLSLIMKDTEDAQGDAARTSESFKNQMKGLKGQVQEAATTLGKELLPIATDTVGVFTELVEELNNMDPELRNSIVNIGKLVAVAGPLLFVGAKIVNLLSKWKVGLAALMTPLGSMAAVLGVVSIAMADAERVTSDTMKTFQKDVAEGLNTAADAFDRTKEKATEVTDAVKGMLDETNRFVGPLERMTQGFEEAPEAMLPVSSEMKNLIEDQGAFRDLVEDTSEAIDEWVQSMRQQAINAIQTTGREMDKLIRKWQRLNDAMIPSMQEVEAGANEMRGEIREVGQSVSDDVGTVSEEVNLFAARFGKLGKALAAGFIGSIGRAVGQALVEIRDLEDALSSVGRIAKSAIGNLLGMGAQAGLTALLPGSGSFMSIFKNLAGVPGMAHGGIVTGPQLIMAGEGRESEAILPLSRLESLLQNAGGGRGQDQLVTRISGDDLLVILDRARNLRNV